MSKRLEVKTIYHHFRKAVNFSAMEENDRFGLLARNLCTQIILLVHPIKLEFLEMEWRYVFAEMRKWKKALV